MRRSQGLYGRATSNRPANGRNALAAADIGWAYAADARLRGGYRRSVRRRRLRSLLSVAAEGLALMALWGIPVVAWWIGLSLR